MKFLACIALLGLIGLEVLGGAVLVGFVNNTLDSNQYRLTALAADRERSNCELQLREAKKGLAKNATRR